MIKSITWKERPGTKSWWISSLNAKAIVMRSTVKLLKRCVFPMPTGFEEFVVVDRIVEKNARATRNESTAYSKKCMSWPRSSAAEELLRLGRGTALRQVAGRQRQGSGLLEKKKMMAAQSITGSQDLMIFFIYGFWVDNSASRRSAISQEGDQ